MPSVDLERSMDVPEEEGAVVLASPPESPAKVVTHELVPKAPRDKPAHEVQHEEVHVSKPKASSRQSSMERGGIKAQVAEKVAAITHGSRQGSASKDVTPSPANGKLSELVLPDLPHVRHMHKVHRSTAKPCIHTGTLPAPHLHHKLNLTPLPMQCAQKPASVKVGSNGSNGSIGSRRAPRTDSTKEDDRARPSSDKGRPQSNGRGGLPPIRSKIPSASPSRVQRASPGRSRIPQATSPHSDGRSSPKSPKRDGSPGGSWNVYGRDQSRPRAAISIAGPSDEERQKRRQWALEKRRREEAKSRAEAERRALEEQRRWEGRVPGVTASGWSVVLMALLANENPFKARGNDVMHQHLPLGSC